MKDYNLNNNGGSEAGPPGQDILAISLALLAAVLGTPYVFNLVGPLIEKLVFKAYGSEDLATFMYAASFVLSGVVIFAATRMALFYAIAAIVAFGSMRLAGMAAF